MALTYDNLSNIRYNSFTGQYYPRRVTNEEHVIPSSSPYIITLNGSPQRTVPSNVVAKILSPDQELLEKDKTIVPGISEFNINYDELGNGQVRVNAVHAGKTLQISYNEIGSLIKKELFNIPRYISNGNYKDAIVEIGGWNMVSSFQATIDFLLCSSIDIRYIQVFIRRDDTDSVTYPLNRYSDPNTPEPHGCVSNVFDITGGCRIVLLRSTSGQFNSANFDDDTINRGFVYILYKES